MTAPAPPRRLRPADRAWLGMRHRAGGMVIDAVLLVDGDLTAADVRRLLSERALPRFPELAAGTEPWDGSDLRAGTEPGAVRDVLLPGPVDRETLAAAASDLVAEAMDPARTPWRIHVVRGADRAATGLVVRLHHSLGDGVAVVAVLEALLDDAPAEEPVARRASAAVGVLRTAVGLAAVVPVGVSILSHALSRRAPLRDNDSGPHPSGGDTGTRLAWTRPHDLAALKSAARACGTGLNDVLLAAVAGGLRADLTARGERADDVRVIVPVDLRPRGSTVRRLGNRIGVVVVRLPVSDDDPRARICAVRQRTRRLTRSPQPHATWLLLQLVGLLPRVLQEAAGEALGASVDAIVTNVPGPRRGRALDGHDLLSVVFWVPRIGGAPLGVSVFSYAGSVTVGLAGGTSGLLAAVERELDALTRLGE